MPVLGGPGAVPVRGRRHWLRGHYAGLAGQPPPVCVEGVSGVGAGQVQSGSGIEGDVEPASTPRSVAVYLSTRGCRGLAVGPAVAETRIGARGYARSVCACSCVRARCAMVVVVDGVCECRGGRVCAYPDKDVALHPVATFALRRSPHVRPPIQSHVIRDHVERLAKEKELAGTQKMMMPENFGPI